MTSRILITGSNAEMPMDAAQQYAAWLDSVAEYNAMALRFYEAAKARGECDVQSIPTRCTTCHGLGSVGKWRKIEVDSEPCPKCGG